MINYSIETKKIISNLSPSKHSPIYDASMYWSQKSFNIADELIALFTKKGDIVFDPFLGSGVTLIESVSDKLSRKAIGCEINDEPVFLIENSLKKRPVKKTLARFESFLNDLGEIEERYYKVVCPACDSEGLISQVVFDVDRNAKILKKIAFRCKNPKCKCKQKDSSDSDFSLMNGNYIVNFIDDIELIPNSKIAVRDHMHISDIFTSRNFKVLDEIIGLEKSKYIDIEDIIQFTLLGIIHLSKITDTHSNSQWPLWTPTKDCVEKNVISAFRRRAEKVKAMLIYRDSAYKHCYEASDFSCLLRNSGFKIFKQGIQTISDDDIPSESVDFILTDPPYLGQVAYSEYMQLYKPFFNLQFNLDDEIVVSSSPARKKDSNNYFDLLDSAFSVCSKVLKSGHYMCMYFHDCNLDVWNKLIKLLSKNGLKYISQVHVDKTMTLKNIISPKKSLNGDSLLIFRKESVDELSGRVEKIEEIEENIVREAKHMIIKNGPQTTPELYDNGLMEIIINNNWLEKISKKYKSLVEIFEKYFVWDSDSARWCTSRI